MFKYPVEVRPCTAKSVPGVVVPTPTCPLEVMMKAVPDALRKELPVLSWGEEVATTKIGRVVEAEEEVACMDRSPHGVLVPTPTLPCESTTSAVVVERVVDERTVERTKRGRFERDEVAETDRRAKGVVEEIPKETEALFQKKFGLSWVRSPPLPMYGSDPCVKVAREREEVAVRVPIVTRPSVVEEKRPETMLARGVKKATDEVAEVKEAVEVEVRVPAVRLPMLEDETSSLTLESSGV